MYTSSPTGIRAPAPDFDLWTHDLSRDLTRRLRGSPTREFRPSWSPSGEEILFSSNYPGDFDIFVRRSDGSDEPRLLVGEEAREVACDWSLDGQYILYRRQALEEGGDLWYLERPQGGEEWVPRPFLQTHDADDRRARFSPNGRFVAYESNTSGRPEIYVRSFPEGEMQGQVSTNGGIAPSWRADGSELFYVEDDTLVAVPVSTSNGFSSSAAQRLFQRDSLRMGYPGDREYSYGVSPNGERFAVVEPVGAPPGPDLCRPELVRRVPRPRAGLGPSFSRPAQDLLDRNGVAVEMPTLFLG